MEIYDNDGGIMSKVVKFLIGLVVALLLIVVILVVIGHFVLVGLFGDNGSVLKLGVKGYFDVFDVYTAVTSSTYKVDDDCLNSTENALLLDEELATHTNYDHSFDNIESGTNIDLGSVNINAFTDSQKNYVSFYAGMSEYTQPVRLNGGMNAVSLDFILQNDFLTTLTELEFHIMGVEVNGEDANNGRVRVIFEVEREELIEKASIDEAVAGFVRSFLHEKLTLNLDIDLSVQDGRFVREGYTVALNSATAKQSALVVKLVNTYQEGMFDFFADVVTEFIDLPTTNSTIKSGDNRVSNVSFDGDAVMYTKR